MALSILPALERPQCASSLYVDHALLAVSAYFASAYGGLRIPSELIRGGLAPWQERRAKEILRARLDGEVSLAELARECELSRSHFARAFKQSIGTSPHRWLLARRAEKAKDLLIRSKLSLAEIALACGFAEPLYQSIRGSGRNESRGVAARGELILSAGLQSNFPAGVNR
jgi:AraC-like DNA-binding protein